ncbi:hypothetical protein K490DRAFT_1450, partial [Saccharata proteae CBS 121410]
DGKRLRACDNCRGLKVKCDPQDVVSGVISQAVPCRRCEKSRKICITTPATKKRAKKSDTRVAELEKKVNDLTSLLANGPGSAHVDSLSPHGYDPGFRSPGNSEPTTFAYSTGHQRVGSQGYGQFQPYPSANEFEEPRPKRRRTTQSEELPARAHVPFDHPENTGAVQPARPAKQDYSFISAEVDKIIHPDAAELIVQHYNNVLYPAFPAVPLPDGANSNALREKNPLFHLAVLSAASYGCEPAIPAETQRHLADLLRDCFADLLWKRGEKSLEIVQSLIISVLWYRAPAYYDQHIFFGMATSALSMALDLGLGKREGRALAKLGLGPFRRLPPNPGSVEVRRTFMACYYLYTNIAMVLRRPMLIRWSGYMDEGLRLLETSPDALPGDRVFCHHLRLAHIGEDAGSKFSMDDPAATSSISDPNVVARINDFEERLNAIGKERPKSADEAILVMSENVTSLYAHEIAMHHNQNVDELNPPYTGLERSGNRQQVLGAAHTKALNECLTSCHNVLDSFLSLDFHVLHALPVMFSVRAVYSTVCITKLWADITSLGDIGSFMSTESLRLDDYFAALLQTFKRVVEKDAQSPHAKFHYIISGLREKFEHMKSGGPRLDGTMPPSSKDPSANRSPSSRGSYANASHTPLHLLSEVAQ